jgi:hypothetical protein
MSLTSLKPRELGCRMLELFLRTSGHRNSCAGPNVPHCKRPSDAVASTGNQDLRRVEWDETFHDFHTRDCSKIVSMYARGMTVREIRGKSLMAF